VGDTWLTEYFLFVCILCLQSGVVLEGRDSFRGSRVRNSQQAVFGLVGWAEMGLNW